MEKEENVERERTDVVCKQCSGYVSRNGKTLGGRLSERIRTRTRLRSRRGVLKRRHGVKILNLARHNAL